MAKETPYRRIDPAQLERADREARPPLPIRGWLVFPAMFLCAAQAVICLLCESTGRGTYLIATQISVIAFAFLILLSLVVNPLLRLTRLIKPLNRAELMCLFASFFISAGISSFGLADQLVPIVAAPHYKYWNTPQSKWEEDVIPHLKDHLYITDPEAIDDYRLGFPGTVLKPAPKDMPLAAKAARWLKHTVSDHATRVKRIPWLMWAKPLGFWLLFVFAMYVMFYSLSVLVYDTWARREKLIFPLARLPEDLIHDDGAEPGTLPSTLKTTLFWVGFLFVFALLGYNGLCQAGWLGRLQPLKLGMNQSVLQNMMDGSIFYGIADSAQFRLMFVVIFTAIGIGFLLPLEISFSLWVYWLGGIAMLMVAIWMAFGATVRAFQSEWMVHNHFVSALGAGGLLTYSGVCLVKMFFGRGAASDESGRGKGVFAHGGRWFLGSTVVALIWLWTAGVNPLYGLAFLGVVILITVGLMRVVAEGGLYWFQIHTGPFHLAKVTGLLKVISAKAVVALVAVYGVLFLDIKTYIAPAILNGFKMQEETRAARRRFHGIIAACILATVGVSLVFILYLCYMRGANQMSSWFFTGGPKGLLRRAQQLASDDLGRTGQWNWAFYLMGAAWVLITIAARRRWFWWLHPIGFVMLANPLMTQLWFSFFIGWLCKKLAVKYGGRHQFARMRPLFIGLILGELVACFVWGLVQVYFEKHQIKIDINRYAP